MSDDSEGFGVSVSVVVLSSCFGVVSVAESVVVCFGSSLFLPEDVVSFFFGADSVWLVEVFLGVLLSCVFFEEVPDEDFLEELPCESLFEDVLPEFDVSFFFVSDDCVVLPEVFMPVRLISFVS